MKIRVWITLTVLSIASMALVWHFDGCADYPADILPFEAYVELNERVRDRVAPSIRPAKSIEAYVANLLPSAAPYGALREAEARVAETNRTTPSPEQDPENGYPSYRAFLQMPVRFYGHLNEGFDHQVVLDHAAPLVDLAWSVRVEDSVPTLAPIGRHLRVPELATSGTIQDAWNAMAAVIACQFRLGESERARERLFHLAHLTLALEPMTRQACFQVANARRSLAEFCVGLFEAGFIGKDESKRLEALVQRLPMKMSRVAIGEAYFMLAHWEEFGSLKETYRRWRKNDGEGWVALRYVRDETPLVLNLLEPTTATYRVLHSTEGVTSDADIRAEFAAGDPFMSSALLATPIELAHWKAMGVEPCTDEEYNVTESNPHAKDVSRASDIAVSERVRGTLRSRLAMMGIRGDSEQSQTRAPIDDATAEVISQQSVSSSSITTQVDPASLDDYYRFLGRSAWIIEPDWKLDSTAVWRRLQDGPWDRDAEAELTGSADDRPLPKPRGELVLRLVPRLTGGELLLAHCIREHTYKPLEE